MFGTPSDFFISQIKKMSIFEKYLNLTIFHKCF